ncbi:MAG: hypothetical protein P1V97_17450 [Planctomycetota bacterium]|nr:hypothetical protein [Planctomycetota bacterium]
MNYLTHYFFNRGVSDHDFHIGVAVPDMLSSFNRKARPNFDRARQFVEEDDVGEEKSFLKGVINHEYGDQIFHSSDYFKHFTGEIKRCYRARTFPGMRVRSWFLAHITLEIALDHALIQTDPDLVDDFYDAFDRCGHNKISENTVSILHKESLGQGFGAYIQRFKSTRFLEHYRNLEGITEAVNRVCLRARQDPFEGKNRMALTELLEQSLEGLFIPETLEELGAWGED